MSDRLISIDSNSQTTSHPSSRIHHLPPELLHIIFDAARQNPPSMTPFTLSHICRSWRSFVLASPSLWTTLVVGQSSTCYLEYYDLWFQRSRKLDLSLYVHPIGGGLVNKCFRDFVYILSAPGRSWKEFEFAETIHHVEYGCQDLAALLIVKQTPKLRKLHIPNLKMTFPRSNNDGLTSMENLKSLAIHAGFLALSPKFFATCCHLRQINLGYDDDLSEPIRLTMLYQTIQHVSSQLEALRIQIVDPGSTTIYRGVPGEGVGKS